MQLKYAKNLTTRFSILSVLTTSPQPQLWLRRRLKLSIRHLQRWPLRVKSSLPTQPLPWNQIRTCRVLVKAPDYIYVEARALLNNASSASFISECLFQSLQLPRTNLSLRISGITGLSRKAPLQSVSSFTITPIYRCRNHSRAPSHVCFFILSHWTQNGAIWRIHH